jgi:hypothetical protein
LESPHRHHFITMPFKYTISGKEEVKDEPLYYFEWHYKGGSTTFGFHGTEREFEAYKVLRKESSEWVLIQKRALYHDNTLKGRTIVDFKIIKEGESNLYTKSYYEFHFDDGSKIMIPDFVYEGKNLI